MPNKNKHIGGSFCTLKWNKKQCANCGRCMNKTLLQYVAYDYWICKDTAECKQYAEEKKNLIRLSQTRAYNAAGSVFDIAGALTQ